MTGHAPAAREIPACVRVKIFSLITILFLSCLIAPLAATAPDAADDPAGPQVVRMGVYVLDFSNYDSRDGTFQTSFYVSLDSDRPVNNTDFEMMNGKADTMGLLVDTPTRKYFRIFATLDTEPDFRRFPFDRHTLPIVVEPRVRNTSEMIIVVDENSTGLDPQATLPGWKFEGQHVHAMNHTYAGGEAPYSQVAFTYTITRDWLSTFLKFFLPVMLIVIVSLSSLLMRTTSRLGLNASMFLAAVLIHWRIADVMPMVEYATVLDYFMIITYAMLVMVLISGILVAVYNEQKNNAMIDRINYWSVRIIPATTCTLYALLFIALLF